MSVAGRLVVGLSGPELLAHERRWLQCWQPAGVIFFARNCTGRDQFMALVADVAGLLPDGAELCADHEGGDVSFLAAAAGRPAAPRTLGDLDDPDLTEQVHLESGLRLRDLGLDRVLAPCCDVLTEPRNPVIGARSFGDQAERVALHVAAAARGLLAAGLKGCAKHWPGHGGTAADTHHHADPGDAADQAPFEAVLAAGVEAVMLAHLPAAPDRPPFSVDAAGIADLGARLGPEVELWCDDISMGALRPHLALQGVGAGDGLTEGLIDPARMSRDWLDAVAAAGAHRLLLRGIPWRALPLEGVDADSQRETATLAVPAAALAPALPRSEEARRRAAMGLPRPEATRPLLWLDATADDRLGSLADQESLLRGAWPQLVRLDAHAPRLGRQAVRAQVLLTSHRPLTVVQAALLEPLLAAVGTAWVLGHPSLAADLGRLAGPGWTIHGLAGCGVEDLASLLRQ